MSNVIPISREWGVSLEQRNALLDAQAHCNEYGSLVTFRTRTEAQVTRGRYGTIKENVQSTDREVRCFPIDFQPNTKRIREAGLFEEVQLIAWSPTQSWIDLEIAFEELEVTRMTVLLSGSTYTVREKGLASMLGDRYLYITWGLWRE